MAVPTVNGALSPEVIRRTVLRNLGQVAYCYEGGFRTNPSAEGRLMVSFVITAEGAVQAVSVSGDYPLPEVRACVQQRFERLTFPRPERGEVRVQFPFVLRPE